MELLDISSTQAIILSVVRLICLQSLRLFYNWSRGIFYNYLLFLSEFDNAIVRIDLLSLPWLLYMSVPVYVVDGLKDVSGD